MSGMIRVALSDQWSYLDTRVGVSGMLLGSHDHPEHGDGHKKTTGYGVEAGCFITPMGWELYYSFFLGNDFRT